MRGAGVANFWSTTAIRFGRNTKTTKWTVLVERQRGRQKDGRASAQDYYIYSRHDENCIANPSPIG